MSSDISSDEDLRRSAHRAAQLGGALTVELVRIWERAFPGESLAAALGCSARDLLELAVCLRPRPEAWIADVAEIAGVIHSDAGRLEAFFRTSEALERLALAHPLNEQVGHLLAARDRDEKD